MKGSTSLFTVAAAAALTLAPGAMTLAQQKAMTTQPVSMSMAPMPSQMEKNGIPYVVGGVGIDARKAMESIAPQYNTQLAFAANPDGHYVVEVQVALLDSSGKTRFELANAGPMLYAKLPPGSYEIVARYHGKDQKRRIEVRDNGSPAHEGFRW